jgi:outer membrane lipoprotein-sorting protein
LLVRKPFILAPVCAALLLTACPDKSHKPKQGDGLALSDALTSLSDRAKLVRDYAYSGEATSLEGGQAVRFAYKLKQPKMLRADVEGIDTSFVFDGTSLAILDHGRKQVLKQDLTKVPEVDAVAALHQIFGDYVCEGWKPPLTRTKADENAATLGKSEAGEPVWVLVTAIDDKDLLEVRYTLRAPTADFLKKEWIAKDGSVFASTLVLQEHRDEGTKLSFPLAWEHKSPQRSYRVQLEGVAINEGLAAEPFTIVAPEGFTLREVGQ